LCGVGSAPYLSLSLSLNYLFASFVSIPRLFVRNRTFGLHTKRFSDSPKLSSRKLQVMSFWLCPALVLVNSWWAILGCVFCGLFNAELDSMRLLCSLTNGLCFFLSRSVCLLCLVAEKNVGKMKEIEISNSGFSFFGTWSNKGKKRWRPSELSLVLLCGLFESIFCFCFVLACVVFSQQPNG
jgi:hypothetical protein